MSVKHAVSCDGVEEKVCSMSVSEGKEPKHRQVDNSTDTYPHTQMSTAEELIIVVSTVASTRLASVAKTLPSRC